MTVDLSKINNVIRNNLVKQMFYDELIKKANSNDSNKQTKKRRRRLDMLITR